ncbi:MAG: hypothetical protein JRN21_09965 [Nitrososphaerota archaeon]|nr:hypothetical protein [Nitrososphaerota archaeon]
MKLRDNPGPLETVFRSSLGRVLDQVLIVGNMSQTIPMLVESTELDYKSVKRAVAVLVKVGLMVAVGQGGHAYAFNMDELDGLIVWATRFQFGGPLGRSH